MSAQVGIAVQPAMSVQGKVLTSDDAGMTVASATRGRRDGYFTGAGLGTPTCRGVTQKAWNLEFQRNGITVVEPIMGVAFGRDYVVVSRETMSIRFEEGLPVALNGKRFAERVALMMQAKLRATTAGARRNGWIANAATEAH
ncbi:MAG: hypothetical protein IPO75_16500 [Betaproteobacteria bacterium]|nr:hypothetical protein [Betaproteobacteria bacterium]